jgi:hypothetical protein
MRLEFEEGKGEGWVGVVVLLLAVHFSSCDDCLFKKVHIRAFQDLFY